MSESKLSKKFTEEELSSIKSIQQRYHEKLMFFGQLSLEKIAMERAEHAAKLDYEKIQTDELALLDSLSLKYGDGSLSLKDGTFTPSS